MLLPPRELLIREESNPPELPNPLLLDDARLRLPARSAPLGRLLEGLVLALGDRGLLERFEADRSEGRFAEERSVGRLADDRSVAARSEGRFAARSEGRFAADWRLACRSPPNFSDVFLFE
jgi:hypothetical protein